MQLETKKYLEDVRLAIEHVSEFVSGKTPEDFSSQILLRSAVERQLAIIGEALNRLSRTDQDTLSRISHYEKIIGFRNVLVHSYDTIDDLIVWDTVQIDLPVLHQTVVKLLEEPSD